MSRAVHPRGLMDELVELARRVSDLERGGGLGHSSFDAGAIQQYAPDGTLVQRIGDQYDGTSIPVSFNGPTPPTPSAPTVEALPGGVRVTWDGLWADALVAPLDFTRVEVHVGATSGYDPRLFTTLRGTIETARGATLAVFSLQPDRTYYVRLVARNASGDFGPPSVEVPILTRAIDAVDLAPVLVLTTDLVAGDPNGDNARMTPNGFQVYRADVTGDGAPDLAVQLGGTGEADRFGVIAPDGDLAATIDQNGRGSFTDLDVLGEPTFMGKKFYVHLDSRAKGLVAFGAVQIPQITGIGTEYGICDLAAVISLDRSYSIRFSGLTVRTFTETRSRIRARKGGTVPTVTDVEWCKVYLVASPDALITPTVGRDWNGGAEGQHRFLWTFEGSVDVANTGTVASGRSAVMALYDQGPALVNTGTINNGGGTTDAGTQPTAPGTPAPVLQRTADRRATWIGTYRGDGTRRTDTGDVIQGYWSPNGNQRTQIGFGDLTAELAGGTVNKVELYLYASNWYYNAGGTAVIGFHGNTAQPATYSGPVQADRFRSGGWPKPGGRWVDITGTAADADSWRSGAYRGVIIGPGPSTDLQYYGRFQGGTDPILRVTYTK